MDIPAAPYEISQRLLLQALRIKRKGGGGYILTKVHNYITHFYITTLSGILYKHPVPFSSKSTEHINNMELRGVGNWQAELTVPNYSHNFYPHYQGEDSVCIVPSL